MEGMTIPRTMIEERILHLRGHRVMLDRDLAELYGVGTKALNQAFRRNRDRFPGGFSFRLTHSERERLLLQFSRLSSLRHARQPPVAFTDYGIAMLSGVLKSSRAIKINIRIIKTFVRLRKLVALEADLSEIVRALQIKVGEHDQELRRLLSALGQIAELEAEDRPIMGFQPKE
jgi:hypothetical protein